jgi:flagellar hook assembly protein FlgD
VTTNLVTLQGLIGTVETNGSLIVSVPSGAASISNLNLTGGQGAIKNAGTMTVTSCVITGNNAFYGGGGIYNSGGMTVTNSTIAGNKATPYYSQYGPYDGGPGGGIYNSGGLTLIASTISGNTATTIGSLPGGSGGGVYNVGTLSVINSTITGNTATISAAQGQIFPVLLTEGGGIANQVPGTLTAINSTITGNTVTLTAFGLPNGPTPAPGSGGGGIAGLSTLENTIVSGNTSNVGPADYEGNFDDAGGNLVAASTALQLAPLGNYGGPTQTMIPLPGSPANCLGAYANVNNAGLLADQRGFPRAIYYSAIPVTCVDAGAVQTDYVLTFTTQPPATTPVNVAMKPAPVVELTESGILFPYYSGEVGLIDVDRALVAPTLAPLVKGVATFSDAVMTFAVTNDALSAVLNYASTPEVPTLNLVGNASVKVSVPVVPGVLISPAPGSTLTSGTVTFTWTASDVPGTQYQLQIGTNGQGSNNIYISPPLNGTSVTVNVPTTGGTLYVGLSQGTTGPWLYTPYTYKEAKIIPAVIVSPATGSTLKSGTVTFTWTASTVPGTQYQLQIGTNGQGTDNIYISPVLKGTSVTVTVPTTGATLYVGLSQGTTGPWMYTPYTYTEAKIK